MRHEIVFDPGACREFDKLPKSAQAAISKTLSGLSDDPRPPGVKKMTEIDAYRIRVGAYRVVYAVRDERLVVLVVKVGHRRDVFKALAVIRQRLKG